MNSCEDALSTLPSSILSESSCANLVDSSAVICSGKVTVLRDRSVKTTARCLLKASVSIQGWNVIFHKDWSGTMIARADVEEVLEDEPPATKADESSDKMQCDNHDDGYEKVEDEGFSSKKSAKNDRKRRQEKAIWYGELPMRLVTDTPFVCLMERTDMSSLVKYYKDRFDGGNSARTFQTAYRAKKGLFVKTGVSKGNKTDFFKEEGQDLRMNPESLFALRYVDVVKGTEGNGVEPRIYHMVRFSYLSHGSFPKTFEIISKRFRRSMFGMKEKAYQEWLQVIKKQPICYFPKESLRWVRFYHFLSKDRTDYRRFCEHMNFFGICPDYWKVARDFPSSIMQYVLKRCVGGHGISCMVCKAMLAFHNENLKNRQIERMLFPESPYLKHKGLEIYPKSVRECEMKWNEFRRFREKTPKVPLASLQRLKLMVELQGTLKKSASTVKELDPNDVQYNALSVPSMWDILENILFDRKENVLLNGLLLKEMEFFLSEHLFIRPNGMTHMLSSVFLLELEFCLLLRSVSVYKNSFPVVYGSVVFPNDSLKCIYERAVTKGIENGGLEKPSADSNVLVIVFSRRYRLKDLVKKMKKAALRGKECVLHVDDQTPFVYSAFDGLQDWYSDLSELKGSFNFETGLPFTLHAKGAEKKILNVCMVEEFKKMMDAAVLGECYVLVSIEDKRRKFLEFSSKCIRTDVCRSVLERSFPSGDVSSYSLGPCPVQMLRSDELTICTPAYANIFGPRKRVYCIGDMWTPKNKQAAEHLATEAVYYVNLSESLLSMDKIKWWQYNDKKVDYEARKQLKSRGTNYACGSFFFIMDAIKKIESKIANITTNEKKREDRVKELRKKAAELHGQPCKKKIRYD